MSASGQRRLASMVAAALMGAVITAVGASGPERLIDDPLNADPQELRSGVTLPGDSVPFGCLVSWNLEQPLALADAANIALCNNPAVKETWEAIKRDAAAVGIAAASYLPTVSVAATLQREHDDYPSTPALDSTTNGHSSYASLSWRIFDFGGRAATTRSARLTLDAALSSHDDQLEKTLDSVVQAYFDAATARSLWVERLRARDIAHETAEATARREDRGAASHNDWLQAEVGLARASLAARRAEGDLNAAIATLVYALGLAPGTHLSLPDPPTPTRRDIGDLDAWLTAAERKHPAIAAARKQWQAAEANVSAVRSAGLPTVDFSANFYQNGYPNQGIQSTSIHQTTIGFTISVPLFEGFARTYQIRQAKADSAVAEAQYLDVEHQTLMQLVKAYATAVSASGNLDASELLLATSAAALDSSRRRYATGAASILELLQAQQNAADAAQQRVQSLAEWGAARLRLLTAAGDLGLHALIAE